MAKRVQKKTVADGSQTNAYDHKTQESLLRPDIGLQAQFKKQKPPKTYRYDSSLDPAMSWDEGNPARERAEALIRQIQEAKTVEEAKTAADMLARMSKPFLNWSGKAERTEFNVPTLPLFTHERLSTQAILATLKSKKRDKQEAFDFYGDADIDIADRALQAYEHKAPWVNRMILGDSLVVMNSLLQYESLGGQVQMIYFDPPYGVKFGSNFQPFVRKRDVKHGDDESMTREPEVVQAYRDTWELGLHSYLTYLRDRFKLAHDLLHPSGSIFVQISDENLHHVREVLDEIFGSQNLCGIIPFKKTSGQSSSLLAGVCDYVLWYGKDKEVTKYRQLYSILGEDISDSSYNCVELTNGSWRRLNASELNGDVPMPECRRFRTSNLTSQGASEIGSAPFEFEGKIFKPSAGNHWKPKRTGLENLAKKGRLLAVGNTLAFKRYIDDFPVVALTNLWSDTVESTFAVEKNICGSDGDNCDQALHTYGN